MWFCGTVLKIRAAVCKALGTEPTLDRMIAAAAIIVVRWKMQAREGQVLQRWEGTVQSAILLAPRGKP